MALITNIKAAIKLGVEIVLLEYFCDKCPKPKQDRKLATGKAWAYKEMLRDLWLHDSASEATDYFNDLHRSVIHAKLEPMKKVARAIKERLVNVVSYFTHEITNAVAEGINSKIQAVKRRVGGYRNKENYMTAIYFYCGGLDLHPH